MSLLPEVSTCQAPIQQGVRKGKPCGNKSIGLYCNKHKRQSIIDNSVMNDTRYCDVARGCYTVLESHQVKCMHCLHKTRITDRKRNDKKRQDPNLCLDCGREFNTTDVVKATGKHDKQLRRCEPCYEKLKKIEAERPVRERQYKAEAFTNKHVIWNHYVKGAKKRGINFQISKTRFNELILQTCFYCDYKKEGEVNGIDRVDNNKGYQDDNVVTCCEVCNQLKGSQHPQEFIDKMRVIYLYYCNKTPTELVEKWKTTYLSRAIPTYKTYNKGANSRNIEFKLTETDFANIVKQSCYLCGLETSDTNHNGIDRFNNSQGYIIENCRSCCGHCNLLKKDLEYDDIIHVSEKITQKYDDLTVFVATKQIPIRSSKIESRVRVEVPIVQAIIPMEYKPLNEIIISKQEIPDDVKEILEKKDAPPPLKQWKSRAIFQIIQSNKENTYKLFCEANNDLTKYPEWETDWITFVLAVKGKIFVEAEPIIKAFIENLRRIRHNQLCFERNSGIVERDNRTQWPSRSVVRAFLDGKIDTFKKFAEEQSDEDSEDRKWIKRWNTFVESLEKSREDEEGLKKLCSAFMTAQRAKRWRKTK
jgi:hypothetical protein